MVSEGLKTKVSSSRRRHKGVKIRNLIPRCSLNWVNSYVCGIESLTVIDSGYSLLPKNNYYWPFFKNKTIFQAKIFQLSKLKTTSWQFFAKKSSKFEFSGTKHTCISKIPSISLPKISFRIFIWSVWKPEIKFPKIRKTEKSRKLKFFLNWLSYSSDKDFRVPVGHFKNRKVKFEKSHMTFWQFFAMMDRDC